MVLDGYSARVIREFYTHIGGAPTRLQASTRYIEYGEFEYITPPTIEKNESTNKLYDSVMSLISTSIQKLEEAGIPKEDTANLLPLGMTTKVVCKINLRTLIDMSHQRMCARAYWEFRQLFRDIRRELKDYSEEWSYLVDTYFEPKCDYLGYCPEKFTCGKMNPKETTSAN
jgi:thymidylate synthase (FAD)